MQWQTNENEKKNIYTNKLRHEYICNRLLLLSEAIASESLSYSSFKSTVHNLFSQIHIAFRIMFDLKFLNSISASQVTDHREASSSILQFTFLAIRYVSIFLFISFSLSVSIHFQFLLDENHLNRSTESKSTQIGTQELRIVNYHCSFSIFLPIPFSGCMHSHIEIYVINHP